MSMKPGKVTRSVTVEQEQAAPANPQSFLYFWVLYTMVHLFMVPFAAVPSLLQDQPSRFKAHGGFFVMMTIDSVSLAVVASGILVLASFVLERWMKDIHYTILKTVGLFSALLAPFSLMCVVFLPMGKLTWIVYSILCLIIAGILLLYNFLWKHVCMYQQNKESSYYLFHWTTFLSFLAPLSITCVRFLPPNLQWATVPIICVSFSIPAMVVVDLYRKYQIYIRDPKQSPS